MKSTRTETACCTSPLGLLEITGNGDAVTSVEFTERAMEKTTSPLPAYLAEAVRQLEEYFAGKRHAFDFPLHVEGTEFQRHVWQALQRIPYGRTESYGSLARAIAKPKAWRAVGMANNRNPFTIIIPCHRVIGSNGAMMGYAGGLHRKEWLLEHEKKWLAVI